MMLSDALRIRATGSLGHGCFLFGFSGSLMEGVWRNGQHRCTTGRPGALTTRGCGEGSPAPQRLYIESMAWSRRLVLLSHGACSDTFPALGSRPELTWSGAELDPLHRTSLKISMT